MKTLYTHFISHKICIQYTRTNYFVLIIKLVEIMKEGNI
jgi:hypothetical protein